MIEWNIPIFSELDFSTFGIEKMKWKNKSKFWNWLNLFRVKIKAFFVNSNYNTWTNTMYKNAPGAWEIFLSIS